MPIYLRSSSQELVGLVHPVDAHLYVYDTFYNTWVLVSTISPRPTSPKSVIDLQVS